MTKRKNLFKTIAIIIALDILYNNFDIIIASMFETENKFIDKIFTIIQLKKAKLKSKKATKNINDAVMAFYIPLPKRRAIYDNLCYNYHQ